MSSQEHCDEEHKQILRVLAEQFEPLFNRAGDLAQKEIKRFVWRTTCTARYWDRHMGIEVRGDNPKHL